ncbi:MAG: FAD-dependent oxidoreductase [Deltaproteobacteria bacterium]|nr:FAD-dependent oxidoreductase [Deltaproteobacteria bacterium]
MLPSSRHRRRVGHVPSTHVKAHSECKVDSAGFIEVDDELCTAMPDVWALGEVNRRGAFTHTAYSDAHSKLALRHRRSL